MAEIYRQRMQRFIENISIYVRRKRIGFIEKALMAILLTKF
jgi:hypothetical protein